MSKVYEYRFLPGSLKKVEGLEAQVNELASDGWEVLETTACSEGGFGFGLAVGSGFGGGGMLSALVVTMRRARQDS